jgi:hypothetical protein
MQSATCRSGKCRIPYWRVPLIPRALSADLLMQIRHNLVVPEKPFFRRGRCVEKATHHFKTSENTGFFRHDAVADRFGFGCDGAVRIGMRAVVAACARRRAPCWRRRTIRRNSPTSDSILRYGITARYRWRRLNRLSRLLDNRHCEERLVRRGSASEGGSDEAIHTCFAAPKLDCFANARNDGHIHKNGMTDAEFSQRRC